MLRDQRVGIQIVARGRDVDCPRVIAAELRFADRTQRNERVRAERRVELQQPLALQQPTMNRLEDRRKRSLLRPARPQRHGSNPFFSGSPEWGVAPLVVRRSSAVSEPANRHLWRIRIPNPLKQTGNRPAYGAPAKSA
ncbi:hypothetical protein [Burkholderia mayonis]|uniref:hypothetical protein n=1 Tax=Burkholderia mayonis TaxID=1385591 RepID=UPI001396796F|nr:hypothetical protein [Burkholderia mayonis]